MTEVLLEHRLAVMGTTAHIVTIGGSEELLRAAGTGLEALEQRWSRFRTDSELSRLNRSAGKPCIVSQETFDLVGDAVEAWRQSDGVFDPTVGSTMVAAGYDRSFADIDTTASSSWHHVPAPGPDGIVFHPYGPAIDLPSGVQLDLGGMAKGAAADLMARWLLDRAVDGCMVNVGGDIALLGQPPRPEGWRVVLDNPGADDRPVINIATGAVCTSTTKKRRWNGPTGAEHHLRYPLTGKPIDSGITSVTVIAARAAQAEVLTKMVLAAGPDGAARVLDGTGATGVFVLENGRVEQLPGLTPFLESAPTVDPGHTVEFA